jgi:hypothetical protein
MVAHSAPLLNTAIWRHHIDGRSGNSSNPRHGKFDGRIVNVEIQNSFILISVYFTLAVLHNANLPG